jgi:hypothetical protein
MSSAAIIAVIQVLSCRRERLPATSEGGQSNASPSSTEVPNRIIGLMGCFEDAVLDVEVERQDIDPSCPEIQGLADIIAVDLVLCQRRSSSGDVSVCVSVMERGTPPVIDQDPQKGAPPCHSKLRRLRV